MRISLANLVAVCISSGLLAACGGDGVSSPTLPVSKSDGSWMRPEAKSENLLYVANYANNDVTVVTYPKGRIVGTLTGFSDPGGLCVDAAGNVWITSSSQILEYAHGGTAPIATLNDPGYSATDCSVDPTTGNLAVSENPANIAVYAHAGGSPRQYVDRRQLLVLFAYCSYDGSGNLFAVGRTQKHFKLTEVVAGGKTIDPISTPQLGSVGGLEWDGQYLALGGYTDIVQYSISGKTATQVGLTPLRGLGRGSGESNFWIQSNTLVVVPFAEYAHKVFLFNYPSGGKPLEKIMGFQSARAAAVSLAQR